MRPADLFITLLHELSEAPDATREAALRFEADPAQALALARQLAEVLDGDGGSGLHRWVETEEAPERIVRVLLAAQAIDRRYASLASVPDTAGTPPADLVETRRWLNREDRLNSDPADGQLIIRRGFLGRAMDIAETVPPGEFDAADLFHTLFLIPPTIPASNAHDGACGRRISVGFTRLRQPADQNPFDPAWAPVVAVVPLAQAEDDIAIRQFRQEGADWYDPVPRDDLGERAAAAIDALARDGANLVLFPEVAVHPAALPVIRATLRRQAVDGPIRYVLAGVKQPGEAGGKPLNRAVLLDRTGDEVAVPTKLHCWDLDADQCRSYGLRSPDGQVLGGLREFIAPGDHLSLIELPGLGRLAVMICEDLDRSQPGGWLGRSMLLDWVVTPVLDSGLTEERWQAREGAAAARTGWCRVVVANSMSFSHRFNRAINEQDGESEPITDCGVVLFFQPRRHPGETPHIRLLTLPLDAPEAATACARWEPDGWDTLAEEGP